MASVTQSIEVGVPVSTAYNQWTQFETFPQFLDYVEEITQLDDTHTHWRVKVAGDEREFDAAITEQHPDERVAWKSEDGTHAGVVTFHRLNDVSSRVTVQLEWQPVGAVEKIGAVAGFDDRAIAKDLENFKTFIENRNVETGAWRGDVG
ncbi:SRPBCC family protein [Gryllotalpicola ginsengisoli]|uniref:SRPBCC family protein n=1 Tax=Gryllotalpicola ginsengisoli TaxID=444608 RepID=UPI00041EA68F|nr:SRPBCC family protein [Gryllotalpicola ginsengisoli]